MRQARGYEIAAWLDEHPEVEQYAIVDDNDEMLPAQRARFVHVDGDNGLTLGDACQLAAIFDASVYDAAPVRAALMTVLAGR